MVKRVNIMIGRFQPFTNGHLKCVEYAWEKLGVPTVLAMIYTDENKLDERHPFSSNLILPIYQNILKDNPMIADIILVKNANIVSIGDILYNEGYEIVSWTCGTDRLKSYETMAERYKEKAYLAPDFQMLEIKRGDEDISATKVRQALIDGDEKTFKKLTPFVSLRARLNMGNNIFQILRDAILKVYNK